MTPEEQQDAAGEKMLSLLDELQALFPDRHLALFVFTDKSCSVISTRREQETADAVDRWLTEMDQGSVEAQLS